MAATSGERCGMPYEEIREERPCAHCGLEIVPGQLYVVEGPLHVYCDPRARRHWSEWDAVLAEVEP
jgi:hypothetical protein